ncbi:tetratricopeptide repeat protein [Sandaracinus amylolyticus]|uniref:O-GlcNAc transferase n=1 Tax=Sandaracinus amylolyticus TaxID=927083 RepID=A0A0F6SET3_9BACT|nr:tetratricopeptide repeat protein [Sandaracinus amylolyticus]AKF05744.1 O-GlcNAc transferase [Sandaracinus amylolyticus]
MPGGRSAPPGAGALSFGDLDLPAPRDGGVDLPTPATGRADLPTPATGRADLPALRADADLPIPRAGHSDLPLPGADSSFGDLELPMPNAPAGRASLPSDDELELPMPAPRAGQATRGHGEVDLGGGGDDEMEFADIPQASPGSAPATPGVAPTARQSTPRARDKAATPPKRGRTAAILIGLMVLVVGAGAALGLTPLGPFGIFALEPFLPGAGDPATVARVITDADALVTHDVRSDSWRALEQLSVARRDAGLHRELLARSLLHESLYQIRFGADAGGATRAAAIRERLTQREVDDPRAALALAADQLRGGNAAVGSRIATARQHTPADPFVDIVEGEAALADGRPADAATAFRAALDHGGGAAAQWGLTRALTSGEDQAAIDAAIEATLAASPMHAGARVTKARRLWENASDEAGALALARQVAGMEPVDGQTLRASAADRADALVLLGRIHERRGRIHQALQSYEAARETDGRRVEAALGAGRMLLEQSPSEALARFEAVLGVEGAAEVIVQPSGRTAQQEAQLGAARAKLSVGRVEEARGNLETLAAQRPEDPEVFLWLGRAEQQLQHPEAAEQQFREAIRLGPSVFESYLALARLYVDVDRGADALAVLEQARTQVPESAEMRQSLGMFELGRNRLPEAIRELRRALELDAQLPGASFGLGVALRRSNRLDDAAEVFERLATIDPGHPGLALERGLLYEARGESDRAVRFYSDALAESPDDPELLLRLGAAQVAANQIEAAEESLTRAQRLTPSSAEVEHFLGRVAFARQNLPTASQHFERALALDATRGEFHLYAGWAALEEGQIGRARERVQEAIRRDPTLGDAYWIRGAVSLRTGAVRDALVDLQRAIELRPERTEAIALMGECYDQVRQLPQAIAAYERAVAARDTQGEWWYRLGRLRLDAGQRAEAARALARATLLGEAATPQPGWLADAHRLQGDALRLGGERAGAIEHYRRYLEIAPASAIDRSEVRDAMMDLGAVPPGE